MKIMPRLSERDSRTIKGLNASMDKMLQLRQKKSRLKVTKVDTKAARDHMRRTEATAATMSIVRKRGMLFINCDIWN